ncbi:hypothetical protein G6671_02490 [Polynucleobacter paneuropaeus]|uniref:Uncharacterized protein n=1 Tax=Polynucleobacter paneuropaeus TaxID=2527775 RepID=A0A9Q2ZTP6_9BURK|nr:hypothetical protein [Polynucleobacter paneuropaeus]QWD37671.1 hypothetical protein G6671_02490 [Polynucleobacter paneuropaeus]
MKIDLNHIILSSPLGYQDPESLEAYGNDFFLHTLDPDFAFVIFDVQDQLSSASLLITNRTGTEEMKARADGLQLQVSENFQSWKSIELETSHNKHYFFANIKQQFRYIKIYLAGKNRILHLRAVELFDIKTGKKQLKNINIERLNCGSLIGDTYYHTYDWGFFSNISTTLMDISCNPNKIRSIDNTYSFSRYKDIQNTNTWSSYFNDVDLTIEDPALESNYFASGLYHHTNYAELNFELAKKFINRYFVPSSLVLSQMERLKKKYKLNLDKLICVYFRGTDKSNEIELVPPEVYFDEIDKLIKAHPDHKILLQSDDQIFFDALKQRYPKIITLSELPLSDNRGGFHNNVENDKFKYSTLFFAIVLLMSQCKFLVTNTSNVSLWILLYRGHSNNFKQIDL